MTRNLTDMLPAPLREWFKGHHAYYDWIMFPTVEYEKLYRIWPAGACTEDDIRVSMRGDASSEAIVVQ